MKYTVISIDEDLDFGCEERSDDDPVMAVVTLQDAICSIPDGCQGRKNGRLDLSFLWWQGESDGAV